MEELFSTQMTAFMRANRRALLTPAIREALQRLDNREADYIWQLVFALLPRTPMVMERESEAEMRRRRWREKIFEEEERNYEREMRSSKRWLEHIVDQGSQYLQTEMEERMEKTIEANMERARRGGVPGTLSRVEAYLNVQEQAQPVYEDGLHGSHPKWMVLFHLLRLGDLVAASKMAKEELSNNSQCSSLANILASLDSSTNIEEDRRIKLRAEWKQNAQDCMDVHKKAVYGLLLGFDCPESNQSVQDWLWARLFSCKFSADPAGALRQLQTMIYAQHGNKYFIGGSPFAAFLLTGQLERAIHVLFRSDDGGLRVHAVHIAMLAQQLQVLMCTPKVSDEILLPDVHEASVCSLNLARLLLLHSQGFEPPNMKLALVYGYFLRHINMSPASNRNEASTNICQAAESATLEAVACARWWVRRGGGQQQRQQQAAIRVQEETVRFTQLLPQLLGLHAFFAAAAEGRHQQALELAQKMRLIPLDPDEVQSSVDSHLMPKQTRTQLRAFCVQLMRSIVALHEQASREGSPAPARFQLKLFAQALVLYSLKKSDFSCATDSHLRQLQSQMAVEPEEMEASESSNDDDAPAALLQLQDSDDDDDNAALPQHQQPDEDDDDDNATASLILEDDDVLDEHEIANEPAGEQGQQQLIGNEPAGEQGQQQQAMEEEEEEGELVEGQEQHMDMEVQIQALMKKKKHLRGRRRGGKAAKRSQLHPPTPASPRLPHPALPPPLKKKRQRGCRGSGNSGGRYHWPGPRF